MCPVRAEQVEKHYESGAGGVNALHGVSMEVAAGESVALVGRSGCGKTTLLNLLGAMDLPTRGSILLAGRRTGDLSDDELTRLRRETVGFIFQFFNLLPTLTVQENIELPLYLGGSPSPEQLRQIRERVRQLLAMVELEAKARAFPHELSGGQLQRVAIARALIHQPRLIVADEPTGNLDSATAEVVLSLLQQVRRQTGVAIVMATHSPEAAAVADRVLHMKDGRIVETTTVA
jgi:ABC-type lipoprotein export system ATPase subunit